MISRWLLPLLAAPALIAADDDVKPDKRMPSFKITMPAVVAPPTEGTPPADAEVVVAKKKDFFGPGSVTQTITLSDAIQWALKNNLDSKVEEVGVLVEEARLRNSYGEFDPVFSFSATRSDAQTPDNRNNISSADAVAQLESIQAQVDAINRNTEANQQFTNAILTALGRPTQTFNTTPLTANLNTNETTIFDQQTDRGEVSIQARSPIGTVIRAGVRTTRLRSTFDGDTRTITPSYISTSTLEGRQPLLKDFGFDANLADVRISRKNRDSQELTWKFRLEATLQNVVSNYYETLLGITDLENKGDAITAGLRLVAQSKRRKELGFLSPYEVQQAQVQLSFDRENLLLAKSFFLDRQFTLKRLILPQYKSEDRSVYLPVEMPSLKVPKLDRDALLATAFEKRLDFKAALIAAESEDIRVKFAKNQRLPQLDVVGSYGWSGLDTGGYQDSWNRMTHSQAPQWQLGITGSFPIGGVQPRAQVDAAKARKQQALLRIKASELEIGLSVERAMELTRTNQQRLKTAQFTKTTAVEAVRVGFRRMEEGLITNFDLIEQQRRLYEARTRELSAVFDLNKSITQLWLATGTVLENLGITFADDTTTKPKPAPAPAPAPKSATTKKK